MRFLVQPILRLHLAIACFAFLVPARPAAAQAPQPNEPSPFPGAQIRELATRILDHAGRVGCKPRDCRIAVMNFTFSSGLTSQLGIQLADQLAQELSSQPNAIPVVDRAQLRSDLERQRIPGGLLKNEKAIRWLGHAVGATSILIGTLAENGSSLQLAARLLSCAEDKAGPDESLGFSYSGPASGLSPTEAFAPQPQASETFSSPTILQAGKSGTTPPSCIYCPNPSYTDAARIAKFAGTVLMEVIVSPEGLPLESRIVRGLPFGLNEAATDGIRNWKFKPSTLNGQPVTVKVMIETMFRLYEGPGRN